MKRSSCHLKVDLLNSCVTSVAKVVIAARPWGGGGEGGDRPAPLPLLQTVPPSVFESGADNYMVHSEFLVGFLY